MAKKQGGLGRDFFSLIDDNMVEASKGGSRMLRISDIEPRSGQPRKDFGQESLDALAESISQHGVLQPILVRENPKAEGFYEIIAGERRWRAARQAGLTELPAVVMDGDDLKIAQLSLIENVQRQNLNPIEEAFAYAELIDSFGLTQDQISRYIGKSRSAISNMMRLLELPEQVLEMLKKDELSAGHARALLALVKKEDIVPLAERVKARQLSVRDVESAVKRINTTPEYKEVREDSEALSLYSQRAYYMRDLERKAAEKLGRRVRITDAPDKKKKTLEISYNDDSDLEAIIERLCGREIFEELYNEKN